MIKYIFNGDTYYTENDVNKAIVEYIYRTESVGDIDVEGGKSMIRLYKWVFKKMEDKDIYIGFARREYYRSNTTLYRRK